MDVYLHFTNPLMLCMTGHHVAGSGLTKIDDIKYLERLVL